MGTTVGNLGHNPDATPEELFKAREGFDVKAHLKATADAPKASGAPASEWPNADAVEKLQYPLGKPARRAHELPKVIGGEKPQAIDMEELQKNLKLAGLKIVPDEPAAEPVVTDETAKTDESESHAG